MYPPIVQKLINLFSKFPTVGPRTAARFVFYLIKMPREEFEEIVSALTNLKKATKICSFCFNPFEDFSPAGEKSEAEKLCPICQDPRRDKTLLALIEKETDLNSIEKTKNYNGLYFILGGTVSALKENDLKKIRIEELEERIKNPENFGRQNANFKEIIIAANPTTEGEATALYIERRLKALQLPQGKTLPKITRLGRGLPVGGELEYADEETLKSAFEGRK